MPTKDRSMQIKISEIFEFGPDEDGNGFYGFIVVRTPQNYKNHIFEYNQATRNEIYHQTQQAYQQLQTRLLPAR